MKIKQVNICKSISTWHMVSTTKTGICKKIIKNNTHVYWKCQIIVNTSLFRQEKQKFPSKYPSTEYNIIISCLKLVETKVAFHTVFAFLIITTL